MRLGILADIHEDVDSLKQCLNLLRRESVDLFVVLGDLFYEGHRVTETSDLLAAAGAVGVWGNHDLGLCHEPEAELLTAYPARVFDFLRTLGHRFEQEDCLFTHGLPHWDAIDPVAYYTGDEPESSRGLADTFAASRCRITFIGHFHRWLLATPGGGLPWKGEVAVTLDRDQRYLVVVGAVCEGWCAVYDTASGVLTPHRLASA